MSTRISELGASKREDNPIKRYYAKPTRKNAINAMCSYCMGVTAVEQKNGELDHIEPGFRTYIRNCTAPACPLFSWRPFQRDEVES